VKQDHLAFARFKGPGMADLHPASLACVDGVAGHGACSEGFPAVHGKPEGLEDCTVQDGDKHIVLLGINLSTEAWLARCLGDLGFTLHRIPETGGGVNLRGGNRIHGILWDLEASSLKGFGMVSQLRRTIPGVPVMVLANPSNKKRIIESLEQGAMDYLTKPIDLTELKNKCVRLFG